MCDTSCCAQGTGILCSGITSGGCCSGHPMGCQGLNPVVLYARQMTSPWYYFSGPLVNSCFRHSISNNVEQLNDMQHFGESIGYIWDIWLVFKERKSSLKILPKILPYLMNSISGLLSGHWDPWSEEDVTHPWGFWADPSGPRLPHFWNEVLSPEGPSCILHMA